MAALHLLSEALKLSM